MSTPSITWFADKDQGPRSENQDAVKTLDPSDITRRNAKGVLLVLCDGVGGEKGGQRASAIASETAFNAYYADSTPPPQALRNAIDAAHQAIRAESAVDSSVKNMASTIVTLAIIDDKLHIAHVGDSRAYLLRGDTISHLTKDHNWVAEQVARGLMTAQEGRVSHQRNIITRSLGASANHSPDVSTDPMTLQPGDRLMICSDGLHGPVEDDQIKAVMKANPLPQRAVAALIKTAKDNHTADNISSIVLNYGTAVTPGTKVPIALIGIIAAIVILLAAGLVAVSAMTGSTDPGATPSTAQVTSTRRIDKRATSVAQGTDASTIPTDPVEENTPEPGQPGQATVTPDLRNTATSAPVIATASVATAAPTSTTVPPTASAADTPRPADTPKPRDTAKPQPTSVPATSVPPTVGAATSVPTVAPTVAPPPTNPPPTNPPPTN